MKKKIFQEILPLTAEIWNLSPIFPDVIEYSISAFLPRSISVALNVSKTEKEENIQFIQYQIVAFEIKTQKGVPVKP